MNFFNNFDGNDALALGMGLLSQGYSTTPQAPLAGLANGVNLMQQGRRQRAQDKLRADNLAFQQQLAQNAENRAADLHPFNLASAEQSLLPQPPKLTSGMKEYQLAKAQGYEGSFLEYQKSLAEAKRTSIVNNVGGALPFKIPSNYMLADPNNPSKGVVPIPGGPGGTLSGEGAKLEEIARGGLAATEEMFKGIESGDFDQISMALGQYAPNFMQSANAQDFERLRDNLTDLVGRLRSGGAITKDEEGRFMGQIPLWSDKPRIRTNKLKTLRNMFGNIKKNVNHTSVVSDNDPLGIRQ
ncbi:MAG: hypothetical protein AAF434_17185 [Pseudomonadota bacterium]